MNASNENSGFYSAVLYLVWPLLALASAFKNYRSSWAKNILWAFIAFYGFSFAIGAESSGADINSYVAEYQNLHQEQMTVSTAQRYFEQSGEVDIARISIAIVLSRFTGSQAILTLVYGIIFGFFFSRNMWFVLERLEGRIKPIVMFLFVCFFLTVPFWDLNGFRFWTATHIFIYGLLPFLFEGKKTGVFWAMGAILFHFAFLVPVGVLLAYIFLGNRVVVYFSFFLATFFISTINLKTFNEVVNNYAPDVVQERTSGYRGEEYVEEYRENTESKNNWYVRWYGRALDWSIVGFLAMIFFKGRDFFSENKGWMSLFCFTLLFFGVANLFSSIPSGGRYVSIASLSALALIILYIQNQKQGVVMKRFSWAALPALLLFTVVAFRTGLYSMSAVSVLGNPIIAFFMTGDFMTLNNFMKELIGIL